MQFIENGPNIPASIVKAQEENRLLLFCGAGVSYPLGLPDFDGLVDDVREKLNLDNDQSLPTGIPKSACLSEKRT